ncbi:hypothetical protein [Melissococcus sp. OM08-11BH]|uniref:hypothetical protein n=1 Tax=Melissococcus sp. OM08-11BH TaxID=2293110 RepID=UPI000E4E933C|nr:hypothetical protein [Melissococcus sp. OM08-11BH]RGI29684.1 hypothetical protein DXC12_07345 [Melissococcus sp. OM08-11BH]
MGILDLNNVKQNKNRWYFPNGKDLEMTSASNAYVEMFKDYPLKSLAREICQNSLDARAINGVPVKVTFDVEEMFVEDIPGFNQLKNEVIPKAKESWPEEKKTQAMLKKMEEILLKRTVQILKISDYNTTGLEQQNWKSLIEQAGSSVKSSDSSAGSFGIGKAAPFAVSDLRMVYYNTLSSNDNHQSIGVMKFVSYQDSKETVTQGVGYFGENGTKNPYNNSAEFEANVRSEKGTDIYIIGFDTIAFPNWKNDIIYSIIDSFLVSIQENQLNVVVDGSTIRYENLHIYLNEIALDKKLKKVYPDIQGYYDVLQDSEHLKFEFKGFESYGINSDEATLFLSNKTENNRKVLMTRHAGMKIFDLKGFGAILKFSGIFKAKGEKINSLLKQLENPNHDKWSSERHENKKMADKFLKQMNKFIRDTVKETYLEKVSEEVDAFGVSDFLPDSLTLIKGKETSTSKTSLVNSKAKVSMKNIEKESSVPVRSNEEGEMTEEQMKKVGIIDGEEGGSGYDGQGQGGGISDDENDFGAGGTEIGNHAMFVGDDLSITTSTSLKRVSNLKYRIIEIDALNGLYNLILKPDKDLFDIRISIDIIGDSGNKSAVLIKTAENDIYGSLKTSHSNVFLNKLEKNKWIKIKLNLNQKTRLKLEVEAYANIQ